MSSLRSLRTLNTSPAVLEPETFLALSTLPYLKTLIIESSGDGGDLHEYDLPKDSFSALQRLRLLSLDPVVTEEL
ncbi:hypothetical protein FRC07_012701, partial [Ceratobasidium sp. 392]